MTPETLMMKVDQRKPFGDVGRRSSTPYRVGAPRQPPAATARSMSGRFHAGRAELDGAGADDNAVRSPSLLDQRDTVGVSPCQRAAQTESNGPNRAGPA